MNEFVAILEGRSEMIPLAGVKIDGDGRAYKGFSSEELLELRSEICAGVALKINTVVSELDISKKKRSFIL